jgi:hypothetical protein
MKPFFYFFISSKLCNIYLSVVLYEFAIVDVLISTYLSLACGFQAAAKKDLNVVLKHHNYGKRPH